jgi:hypothetical protein
MTKRRPRGYGRQTRKKTPNIPQQTRNEQRLLQESPTYVNCMSDLEKYEEYIQRLSELDKSINSTNELILEYQIMVDRYSDLLRSGLKKTKDRERANQLMQDVMKKIKRNNKRLDKLIDYKVEVQENADYYEKIKIKCDEYIGVKEGVNELPQDVSELKQQHIEPKEKSVDKLPQLKGDFSIKDYPNLQSYNPPAKAKLVPSSRKGGGTRKKSKKIRGSK